MILRATISAINDGSRFCTVEIPSFKNYPTDKPVLLEAAVCITPGIYKTLAVGDTVFVGFDEGRLERPLILGKFYLNSADEEEQDRGRIVVGELVVKNSIKLPENATYLGFGENAPTLAKKFQDLETKISELETKINGFKIGL